jgi:hypothetical protein
MKDCLGETILSGYFMKLSVAFTVNIKVHINPPTYLLDHVFVILHFGGYMRRARFVFLTTILLSMLISIGQYNLENPLFIDEKLEVIHNRAKKLRKIPTATCTTGTKY